MCMVSLYMLAIVCCHTIDWDIFLSYWCLSQIYYYYYYYYYYYLFNIYSALYSQINMCYLHDIILNILINTYSKIKV